MKSKKIISILLIVSTLYFYSCKPDESILVDTTPPPCSVVSNFTIVQDGNNINFSWIGSIKPIEYQISYGLASQTFVPGESQNAYAIDDKTALTIDIKDLNIPIGTTGQFFIRSYCLPESGEWLGPYFFTPEEYCPKPYDVLAYTASGSVLWEFDDNDATYEIEFGPTGFERGTGQLGTSSQKAYSDMIWYRDSTYDFYVRAKCSGGLGFSSWAGPTTFTSDDFFNICPTATNIKVEVKDVFGTPWAYPTWETYGFDVFIVTFVPRGADPDVGMKSRVLVRSGNFPQYPINTAESDFYVKTECESFGDDAESQWAGPIPVNY